MKVFNLINAKGKTVRVRQDEKELLVDADGRYFSVPLAGENDLVSVSVAEHMILLVTAQEGLTAYSYAGQKLFTLEGLVGGEVSSVVNGTVMNPFEALAFMSRVSNAPLVKEHSHYYGNCADGDAFLIDLADGTLVYRKKKEETP